MKLFQSTHPLRGATGRIRSPQRAIPHFNPRTPCGVRPRVQRAEGRDGHFNPRTPCGVRLPRIIQDFGRQDFNPRTPCGVRLNNALSGYSFVPFQSTHPLRGATRTPLVQPIYDIDFNPRTPCGVRREWENLRSEPNIISIHAPLAGCDRKVCSRCGTVTSFQSTHPLRGATCGIAWRPDKPNISIHAPLAGCD